MDVTVKDRKQTHDSLGRRRKPLVTPHCLWGSECHLCHRDTHSDIHEQYENTKQAGPTDVQQPRTEPSRAWGKGRGRRAKENLECPLAPCHQPCHLEWQGGGREGEEIGPVSEGYGKEPSGSLGLQEAPFSTSVTRGLRQGVGCFLPVASVSPLCTAVS